MEPLDGKSIRFAHVHVSLCCLQFNTSKADAKVYATCVKDAANWNLLGQPGEQKGGGQVGRGEGGQVGVRRVEGETTSLLHFMICHSRQCYRPRAML